jgi:hypothetical protein
MVSQMLSKRSTVVVGTQVLSASMRGSWIEGVLHVEEAVLGLFHLLTDLVEALLSRGARDPRRRAPRSSWADSLSFSSRVSSALILWSRFSPICFARALSIENWRMRSATKSSMAMAGIWRAWHAPAPTLLSIYRFFLFEIYVVVSGNNRLCLFLKFRYLLKRALGFVNRHVGLQLMQL